MKVYQAIAIALQAMQNCEASGNREWRGRHLDRIRALCERYMPHGAGLDAEESGHLVRHDSTPNKLIFNASYHHMSDNGMYDGWSEYRVVVTPDLAAGFNLRVVGKDRNGTKEYLADTFHDALSQTVNEEC